MCCRSINVLKREMQTIRMNIQLFLVYLMVTIDTKSTVDYVSCVICLDSTEISLTDQIRSLWPKAYNDHCHPKQSGFFDACYVMFEIDHFLESVRFSFFGWNSSSIEETEKTIGDNLTIVTTIDEIRDDLRIRTKLVYTCIAPLLCNDLLFEYLVKNKPFNRLFSKNLYEEHWLNRFHILLQAHQFDIYLLCFVDGFKDSQHCDENCCSLKRFHDQNQQTCGGGDDAQIIIETLITPANKRFEWISFICNSDECNNLESIPQIANILKSNSRAPYFFWPTNYTRTRPTTTSSPFAIQNQSST